MENTILKIFTVLLIPENDSDCEIIIDLYLADIQRSNMTIRWSLCFIIYDNRTNETFVARDPFGIRPLFYIYRI